MLIKSACCPANPIQSDILDILIIVREYLSNPVLAVAHWRNANYTRLPQSTLDTLPPIVRDEIEEMIKYFRQYGIARVHIIQPRSDKTIVKYVDARRSIVLIIGKRADGKTDAIRTKRIEHTPKHYHSTRDINLAYNRKHNATQGIKQYDYKER